MTGSIKRSSTPPLELISSMARSVAFSWDCSIAQVTPVWENSTPTRHGASVFTLGLMNLTWTVCRVKYKATLRQIAGNTNRGLSRRFCAVAHRDSAILRRSGCSELGALTQGWPDGPETVREGNARVRRQMDRTSRR